MLSEKEKEGCHAILQNLPDDEVMALAQTTTAHQLALTSRKEALDAVVTFTTDAVDLLRRKKMKRGYLFRYLADKKVPVSATADKAQLIQTILELWGSDLAQTRLRPDPAQLQQQQQQQQQQQNHHHHQQGAYNNGLEPQQQQLDHQQQQLIQQQQQQHLQQQQQQLQQQIQQQSTACDPATLEQKQIEQRLSLSFAEWFYKLLNSQNPSSGITSTEEFGAHHFYSDCKLRLVCATSELSRSEYAGSELTAHRLRALVCEEQLLLNPNLCPEGTRARSEPHGLKEILVCGTVHQRDSAIGIFEQQFGLVQEPVSNVWKIKYTNLKLRTQAGLEHMPTLELTSQTLAIES